LEFNKNAVGLLPKVRQSPFHTEKVRFSGVFAVIYCPYGVKSAQYRVFADFFNFGGCDLWQKDI